MKPKSASDILRQLSPRKTIGTSFFNANRFNPLRDNSPASSVRSISSIRDRSASTKRKSSEDLQVSYATVTKASALPDIYQVTENIGTTLTKVRSLCESAAGELATVVADPKVISILGTLVEAVRGSCMVHQEILQALPDATRQQVPFSYNGTLPKKPRPDSGNMQVLTKSGRPNGRPNGPPPSGNPVINVD